MHFGFHDVNRRWRRSVGGKCCSNREERIEDAFGYVVVSRVLNSGRCHEVADVAHEHERRSRKAGSSLVRCEL